MGRLCTPHLCPSRTALCRVLLSTCQNIEYKPWKEEPCKGPCGWDIDVVYTTDPLCKEKLKFVFNGKLLDLPVAEICEDCFCLKEPKNVPTKNFVTYQGKTIVLADDQYPFSFRKEGKLYSFVKNGEVYVNYHAGERYGFAKIGTEIKTEADWNAKTIKLKLGTTATTVTFESETSIKIGEGKFNVEACFRGGDDCIKYVGGNDGSLAYHINKAPESCLIALSPQKRMEYIKLLDSSLGKNQSLNREDEYDVGFATVSLLLTNRNKAFEKLALDYFTDKKLLDIWNNTAFGFIVNAPQKVSLPEVTVPIMNMILSYAENAKLIKMPPLQEIDFGGNTFKVTKGVVNPFILDYKTGMDSDFSELESKIYTRNVGTNNLKKTIDFKEKVSFNGNITFEQNYVTSFSTPKNIGSVPIGGLSIELGRSETNYYPVEINDTYDPYEIVSFISLENHPNVGIFKDKVYKMPALWGLYVRQMIIADKSTKKARIAGNVIAIGSAVMSYGVSAAETPLIAQAVTSLFGGVAFADVIIQANIASADPQTVISNQEKLETWEHFYMWAMLADGIVSPSLLAAASPLIKAEKMAFGTVGKVSNFVMRRKAVIGLKSLSSTGVSKVFVLLNDFTKNFPLNFKLSKPISRIGGILESQIAFRSGDVIAHYEGGKYIMTANGVTNSFTELQLAYYMRNLKGDIRLLSCSDLRSAENIAKAIGKDVTASDEVVKLFSDGSVETGQFYKISKDGVKTPVENATLTKPTTIKSKYLLLGKVNGAGKLVDNLNLGSFVKKIGQYDVYDNGEVFYRAINQADFDHLVSTGKIRAPLDRPNSEIFTSPSLSYIQNSPYLDGTKIIKFKLKPGSLGEFKTVMS